MKFIANLRFVIVLLCVNKVLSAHLSEHDVVGVRQKKFTSLITEALLGYRHVLRNGDNDLGHLVMDPAILDDLIWHVNRWPRMNFVSMSDSGSNFIGLSNYQVKKVNADLSGLRADLTLEFEKLEAKIPYEIFGSMLKNILPIYGAGIASMEAQNVSCRIFLDFVLDEEYINVENVEANAVIDELQIQVTGLMDLNEHFVSAIIKDIITDNDGELIDSFLSSILYESAVEAFDGMTMDELFDFIRYLSKKTEP